MATSDIHTWGIVLAGGEGKRLQAFVENLYGVSRPKQYCPIVGTRTMLQHTRDRVKRLLPPERIVVLATEHHRTYFEEQLHDHPSESLIVQPCNRGTAAGILLPLLHVFRRDAHAMVTLFPSDHFIVGEERFIEHITRATTFAQRHPKTIVLLGYRPSVPEAEYGWIEKGRAVNEEWSSPIFRVARFWEKPDMDIALNLFYRGCLWNTLILIGTVRCFLRLFKVHLATTFSLFRAMSPSLGSFDERDKLAKLFECLPVENFSYEVLAKNVRNMCVLQMSDVYWSDWGDERRVLRDVERFQLTMRQRETISPVDKILAKVE